MNEVAKYEDPGKGGKNLASVELGRWMGRRDAFGLMAGRATAADIESLRRTRDDKLYRELDCTWAQFCTLHLNVARRSVDRAIGHLQEFGPAFFHITQLAHIGPKDYRAIAGHVNDKGVEADGGVVALLPENSEKVSAAVARLLKRIEPKKRKPTPPSFDSALRRCQSVADLLEELQLDLDVEQRVELAAAVAGIRQVAAGLGVVLFP